MPVGDYQNYGPATIDGNMLEPLLIELKDSIEVSAAATLAQRGLYCGEPHIRPNIVITTAGIKWQPDPQGGGTPDIQHLPTYKVPLTYPERQVISLGLKERAWEEGLTTAELRRDFSQVALDFDAMWQLCITQAKVDGLGFYNGTMTPPPVRRRTFELAHSHYLAYAASGIPTVEMMVDATLHITEHGFAAAGIFAQVNRYTLGELIKAHGELTQTDQSIVSPIIQRMQAAGLTTQYEFGGVKLGVEDSFPNNYMWVGTLERMPMALLRPANDDMNMKAYADVVIPNTDLRYVNQWSCWAQIPDVIEPGSGVAIKMDGEGEAPAYEAPTALISLV